MTILINNNNNDNVFVSLEFRTFNVRNYVGWVITNIREWLFLHREFCYIKYLRKYFFVIVHEINVQKKNPLY